MKRDKQQKPIEMRRGTQKRPIDMQRGIQKWSVVCGEGKKTAE